MAQTFSIWTHPRDYKKLYDALAILGLPDGDCVDAREEFEYLDNPENDESNLVTYVGVTLTADEKLGDVLLRLLDREDVFYVLQGRSLLTD